MILILLCLVFGPYFTPTAESGISYMYVPKRWLSCDHKNETRPTYTHWYTVATPLI